MQNGYFRWPLIGEKSQPFSGKISGDSLQTGFCMPFIGKAEHGELSVQSVSLFDTRAACDRLHWMVDPHHDQTIPEIDFTLHAMTRETPNYISAYYLGKQLSFWKGSDRIR
jgi:hypothetical protein